MPIGICICNSKNGFRLNQVGVWLMKLKKWWMQSKKSFRYFVRTKDIDHIKDIWRLTKFYAQK